MDTVDIITGHELLTIPVTADSYDHIVIEIGRELRHYDKTTHHIKMLEFNLKESQAYLAATAENLAKLRQALKKIV